MRICEMWWLSNGIRDYPIKKVIYYVILLTVLYQSKVNCLTCINCSNLRDPKCADGVGNVQYCNETQKYCLTYGGFFKKGTIKILFRSCASLNLTKKCISHYEKVSLSKIERIVTCYNTCNTDLCNNHIIEHSQYGRANGPALSPWSFSVVLSTGVFLSLIEPLWSSLNLPRFSKPFP